jgi:hypothetical protein
MRSIALAVGVFVLNLAIQPPGTASAQSGQPSPDFDLAYVLATASYCAYAVGEADADQGQARALQCLKVAAGRDPERLGVFSDIEQDDVEAFINPNDAADAYLLVWTKKAGAILAFRGTLTPPISPNAGFVAATADAIAKYKAREATLLTTFMTDWTHDLTAAPNPDGRHMGFDKAWTGLREHLVPNPVPNCSAPGCSKFLSYVDRLRNMPSLRLFITGHSKGGALATLAAIDLPGLIGGGITPVVYTFAAAKALTLDGAKRHSDTVKNIWRFEHEFDIVPSVPPDSTVTSWLLHTQLAYTHVGGRVLFAQGGLPQPPNWPERGVDGRGDLVRLTDDAQNLLPPISLFNLTNLLASFQRFSEIDCRSLVDNHFVIFADIQGLVHAQHAGAPATTTEENLNQSFFYTGLPDAGGGILWGYSQWCSQLTRL